MRVLIIDVHACTLLSAEAEWRATIILLSVQYNALDLQYESYITV